MGGVSAFATILFERRDAVAWVTLNRPEVLNAYDTRMRDDLYAAFGTVRDDRSIRALVLRGAGRAFCAGGDLREFGSAPSAVAAREVRWRRDVWGLLRSLAQPTIAAVHGHAAGSGCEMALLCDFRIAASDAVFSLPETALGMIPGVIGTQTAPRVIGLGRALDLVLTGRTIDARLAERLGIVGSVVSARRLDAEAQRLARRLTRIDGELSAALKRLVWRALDRGMNEALREERIIALRAMRIADGRKGRAK
jgi:enoyl-CoA hydratase/carnithine racemase